MKIGGKIYECQWLEKTMIFLKRCGVSQIQWCLHYPIFYYTCTHNTSTENMKKKNPSFSHSPNKIIMSV